jgi:phenylalanyl-tRNA synthetase beta chain
MPTITVKKSVFEKLVGKELPLDVLKDRISYLGTDLEKIEDDEIVVEIFPDRPDMLSIQGFARAFSSFIGVKTGLIEYAAIKSKEKVIIDASVKKVRPFTACAIVKNLHFDDEKIKEVIQIQEKLHITYGRNRKKAAIGIYPCEKIKFPIRFTAKKPEDIKFQPLEFSKEMLGSEILSKHSAGREYGHLLDGLEKYPVFIDANNEILSMPPIINSHKTGKITEQTKDVFIECSGFDFNVLSICLNIIVTALADMGGEVYSLELVYPDKKRITPDLSTHKIYINIDSMNKRLGLKLSEAEVKKYLSRMGYDYLKGKAIVPSYRADILHEVDIYDDIAKAYGYENFKDEIPKVATIAEEDGLEKFKNTLAHLLVGLNLMEVSSYHLTNKENMIDKMNVKLPYIELENASSDYNILRAWLIPCLLNVLKENKRYDYPQRIFEIGTVFTKNSANSTGIDEHTALGIMIAHNLAGYTEIKQIVDAMLSSVNLDYAIEETEHDSFISGRVGAVIVKQKKIAILGEIHPKCLEDYNLETPIAAFELNLTELFRIITNN